MATQRTADWYYDGCRPSSPGTTFSDIGERGGYDSAAHATMTMDELEGGGIALEITRYHADRHGTLGNSAARGLAVRPRPGRVMPFASPP